MYGDLEAKEDEVKKKAKGLGEDFLTPCNPHFVLVLHSFILSKLKLAPKFGSKKEGRSPLTFWR